MITTSIMKKFMILAAAAMTLIACSKDEKDAKEHEVQTEFEVRIGGAAKQCVSVSVALTDFEGNVIEEKLNNDFNADKDVVYTKTFKTSTVGKSATFKANIDMNKDGIDYEKMCGPFEIVIREKTTGKGLEEDVYEYSDIEKNNVPISYGGINLIKLSVEAAERTWGNRVLTVTHTADGYDVEMPPAKD